MKKAYMILDLQFGSTGKGSLAGYLANKEQPDTIATAWGPNAGHTYIDPNGRKFIHRMLANGIVSSKLKNLCIGPGSVIDAQCLFKEMVECSDLLHGVNIIIHSQAAIVLPEHLDTEKSMVSIGSTMKGTGAAVMQRIQRDPEHMNTADECFPISIIRAAMEIGVTITICSARYAQALNQAQVLQVEGAQGFSLSIYHGLYPYTTSRDVTPAQVMADCAIPWSIKPEVYGTLRTFPIRVANRYDDEGNMIGTSGPGYYDQEELSWADVGIEPELTTVTQLPRRIFNFSYAQLADAVLQCAPDKLFLNFANYMTWEDYVDLGATIESTTGIEIAWHGTGPAHNDVIEDISALEDILS